MKIVFDPKKLNANAYIKIINAELKINGIETFSSYEFFRSYNLIRSAKYIHLNWFENVTNGRSFLHKLLKLIIWLVLGKKIIWTFHNIFPHSSDNVIKKKLIIFLLFKFSYKIVIHSRNSEELILMKNPGVKKKIVYIPHPNYIDVYNEDYTNLDHFIAENEQLNLVFVGMVKPYKNIELLIKVIKELSQNVNLTIVGKPIDKEYEKQLVDLMSDDDSFNFDLNFLTDVDLIKSIKNNDLVILPYDKRSSLNSGTALLSFSYARTVICPLIGTIKDLEDKKYVLSYDYIDRAEHEVALKSVIIHAFELKKKDPEIFLKWGLEMKNQVAKNNSKTQIGKSFSLLYQK